MTPNLTNSRRVILFFIVFFVFLPRSYNQPLIVYNEVIRNLAGPLDIVDPGDGSGRVFIVHQGGSIKVYDRSFSYLGDFLTITNIPADSDNGLLSMAFHPDYKNNGLFFIYYTNSSGDLELTRYKVSEENPNIADTSTKTIVMTIVHPTHLGHNGAKLNFGPDGYLYFATGDGSGGGDVMKNGQNGRSLLAKMLRIDVTHYTAPLFYSIPADNPYVKDSTIKPEIWAFGLRNPWRWSFDRLTHDMWIADVGQDSWEEVNYRPAGLAAGANYGWSCYEGTHPFNTDQECQPLSNYVAPILEYQHMPDPGGYCATGGYVYRGSVYPSLYGQYFFVDFITGVQWLISPGENNEWQINRLPGNAPPQICTFGEAEDGELYAVSFKGSVYKIGVRPSVQNTLIDFTGNATNYIVNLNWNTSFEQEMARFEIEYSTDGVHFNKIGSIRAANSLNGSSYKYDHVVPAAGNYFYRLKTFNTEEKWDYSKIITITVDPKKEQFIFPSVITNKIAHIFISEPYTTLEIISMNGAVVLKKNITGISGRMDISVPFISKGIYIARLKNNKTTAMQKIFIQ